MEDVRVCRICLAINVKVYDLNLPPLNNYFVNLTGIDLLRTMELPSYICFECVAHMKRYYDFREKCFKGQDALYKLLKSNGKITEKDLLQVDRQYLQLSHLVIHVNPEPIHHEHIEQQNAESSDIKEEQIEEDSESIADEDGLVKEENYDDFPQLWSSDDELLLFHKNNKEEKKAKKKDMKKVKKDKQKVLDDEDICEKLDELPTAMTESQIEMLDTTLKPTRRKKTKTPPIKPKVSRPRTTKNTGGVLNEDFDLEEYVTIITLSLEEQVEEVTNRQHSSNYKNAPFQCSLCYKGFIDTAAWNHHLAKHSPSAGSMECGVCKFRFSTRRALLKHAANHEKKYSCKACPYVSKTATQAKQHQRWHKGVTYKCQYCDEILTKWTSYLSHVRIKHPSEFICGVCGYSFVSKLGLTMHKSMMHKDIEKVEVDGDDQSGPYCKECDVKFVSEEAWKRHMVTSVKHTHVTNFNNGCRACGSTFSSIEALREHNRKEHARKRPHNYGKKPSKTTWPRQCIHCPEQIANARDYWTHFRRMHPDQHYPIQKNHICDICGKSFRGNAFLMYHKRTHSEEKQFKCGTCGKAFHNRANLHMHDKTHSDVRPYPCAVCFKAFKGKGALNRHLRCHTGAKPYICEVCGKGFGQSNSRKLHVRTVHLKQPAPYVSQARLERRARNREHALPTF